MTGHRRVEIGLWCVAAVATAVTVAAVLSMRPVPEGPATDGDAVPTRTRTLDPSRLISAARVLVAEDPFRLARRPADVRYGSAGESEGSRGREPAPSLPDGLVLAGTIGGPPWAAILEGLPGHRSGLVVRTGDSVQAYRVGFIGPGRVELRGPDSVAVLSIRTFGSR